MADQPTPPPVQSRRLLDPNRTRRSSRRPDVLPCPYSYEVVDMHEKDEVAASLIAWHFRIEPELRAIYQIISADEDAAARG